MAISYLNDGARRFFLASAWISSPTSPGLYYSDNFGQSWGLCQNELPQGEFTFVSVAPSDPNRIATGDTENRVFISTDRGDSWAQTANIPRRADGHIPILEFDPYNSNHIFASSDYMGIYETTDMGQHWTNINNDLPLDPEYPEIWGIAVNQYNPSNLLVSSNHWGVYQTHNGGAHWESLNAGLDTAMAFRKIYFLPTDTNTLFLSALNRSVWSIHRTAAGIAENSLALPNKITLSSYPNPFNSSTIISYSSPNVESIEIYDLLGRKIRTLDINSSDDGIIIWDATDASGKKVSSGIYFARVETPQAEKSIKLLYIK